MILDVAHRQIFPTEMARIVTDLDHKAIEQHTIDFISTHDKYTTYHNKEANDEWQQHPEIQKLLVDIVDSTDRYLVKTKRKPFKEDPWVFIWANVYTEGVEHGSHNHPRSLVSGTYYANEHESYSSIQFDSPLAPLKMHDTQDFNSNSYGIKPKTGDMLLWPSWLHHRVPQQRACEIPRVSISFNVDYNEKQRTK
jgi:uncharacterized protein (TIGR02466 family)